MRKNFSTHTPSELRVGYSRAVQCNSTLYVSGTTSVDETGKTIGSSLYDQTKFIFEKITRVVEEAEFSLQDIVLVRAFVVDLKQLTDFDRAFKETFFEIKPGCTLVGINALVAQDLLIEIEVIAQKSE